MQDHLDVFTARVIDIKNSNSVDDNMQEGMLHVVDNPNEKFMCLIFTV